jgi:hypothetical protein
MVSLLTHSSLDEQDPRYSNRRKPYVEKLAVSLLAGDPSIRLYGYAKPTSRLCIVGSGIVTCMRRRDSAQLKMSKRVYTWNYMAQIGRAAYNDV